MKLIYIFRILTIFLLPFFGCNSSTFSHEQKQLSPQTEHNNNVKIKIPSAWINKLRNYDYKQSNLSLLEQFEKFIKPDSLVGSNEGFPGGFINPIFVDIDSDGNDELIGLFGWDEYDPTLVVFKIIDKTWYLLYFEHFNIFNTTPELQVANNFSANKTFYIRWLYERGSGIYCDAYHFYKLIDNKVYPCLALINNAHILGWGLYLNQIIEMDFKFNSASTDNIWVTYKYNFFSGPVYEDDVSWSYHDDISFVKSTNSLMYGWDSATFTYQPQFYDSPDALTKEKIACFGAFDNDTLFVKAFEHEIKQTLGKGTSEQKKLLKEYLDIVQKEQHAVFLLEK